MGRLIGAGRLEYAHCFEEAVIATKFNRLVDEIGPNRVQTIIAEAIDAGAVNPRQRAELEAGPQKVETDA